MAFLLLALAVPAAFGQHVTPVPKLDLNRFTGVWYEIAEYPPKPKKQCLGGTKVLYALGDKPNTFQMGTFCHLRNGKPGDTNATGKMDKQGDGALKLNHLVLFHTKYWVLATGPDYDWALIANPNRKSLWVLSRTAEMAPETLTQIEGLATAQGLNTAKLVTVSESH